MKRKTAFIMAGVICLLALVLAGWYLGKWGQGSATAVNPPGTGPTSAADQQPPLPEQISGLPLTALVSGPEAVSDISRMHGKGIAVVEGYIARYTGGDREITLWVSVSASEAEAAALFRVMDAKMPASRVFTQRKVIKLDNKEVISVQGMGLSHFYWLQGKYNYWLATNDPASTPSEALFSDLFSLPQ
ncbi:MAG TPA: hypothetical protein VHS59_07640 [Bacillota bacterium]|nr:hypothetical protein [Bacillota bacterium]